MQKRGISVPVKKIESWNLGDLKKRTRKTEDDLKGRRIKGYENFRVIG